MCISVDYFEENPLEPSVWYALSLIPSHKFYLKVHLPRPFLNLPSKVSPPPTMSYFTYSVLPASAHKNVFHKKLAPLLLAPLPLSPLS